MVDILVVIDIALQRAVGGNPLTKEDGVHDGLTVDSITDSRIRSLLFCQYSFLKLKRMPR